MERPNQQLEELYTQMGPKLLAYFRRHRAVAGAAEDLVQDTFVRAMRNFDRVRESVSPRAYLFGIARNVYLDALRRYRALEELSDMPAAEAGPSNDARLEQIREAIAELPLLHRETLLLKLQQELSYEEIAEILGVPVGTVRSRLHYAVATLKQALNPPMNKSIATTRVHHES
jgi:RNA polymerase sigma-70 factor (ECF subfamily)